MSVKIDLRELQLFIQQCDPSTPLDAGDPRYVDLDDGEAVRRAGEDLSCIEDIERTILMSNLPTCQLFTGFPGTGKTTELRRLARGIEKNQVAPLHAILIDFEEYLNPYAEISITDVLRVLAFTLDREATRAEQGDPDQVPGYARRLFDFLATTDAELKKLGFEKYGASLMFELKNNPTFKQRTAASLALRFQMFANEARASIAESLVRIREATHAQQVVAIADGLEKITHVDEKDRAMIEGSVATVFVEQASFLRLPCHTVYTFPFWLRFRTSDVAAKYDREAHILPMVRIAEPDGRPHDAGFAKLTELVGRRLDVSRVFGPNPEMNLRRIVEASGGYPRDLLRMIREVLYTARSFPVSPPVIDRVVAQLAETYARTIRTPDVDILAEVARTHDLPRGDDARLAAFGGLLQKWLVLAYRNDKEWYDLHPLVRQAPIVKDRLAALLEP